MREEAAIDSMLGRRRRFEPITLLGLFLTVALHGGAVTGIILYRRATQAAPKQYDDQSYVVAKLVRLGKPRDEKKMPDKVVPQEATRKEEGVDLTADASDAPSKKKKKDEDRNAKVSDKIRHSLDKAELLAEAAKQADQEGSPDGVVGGTARSGREGDPWMTKVADLFTRTWSPPAVIPRDERERLYVLLRLRIDSSGKIQTPIQFDRRSGNAIFDNSIDAAWQAIKQIPLPPADRLPLILANGLKLKINWKGLQ